jgi:hypothetical protein
MSSAALTDAARSLNEITQGHPDRRVINMSYEMTRTLIYGRVMADVTRSPELQKAIGIRNPSANASQDPRSMIESSTPDELQQAVMDYVDQRMNATDSAYHKALAAYQASVRATAETGVAVVVATGNEHLPGLMMNAKPGAEFNFLAESPDVISVAASNDKHTPNDPSDDVGTLFSSRGGAGFNPTISANGVDVPTDQGPEDGTSFSTPGVSAAVVRIMQANPNLTVAQVQNILRATATDTSAPEDEEGAGILNADKAVALAKQTPGELKRPDGSDALVNQPPPSDAEQAA